MARTLEDILCTSDEIYDATIRSVMEVMDCNWGTAVNIWDHMNEILTNEMRKLGYDLKVFSLDQLAGLQIRVVACKKIRAFWLEINGERKSFYLVPWKIKNQYRVLCTNGDLLN